MQQRNELQRKRKRFRIANLFILIIALFLLVVSTVIGILSIKNGTSGFLFIIIPIIASFGLIIALFQWLFPVSTGKSEMSSSTLSAPLAPQTSVSFFTEKTNYRAILGFPPSTDSPTIQQREKAVKEVYTELTQPEITAITLTGIGGAGKSTLAALVYAYAEKQRHLGRGPFVAEALWLSVDQSVTMSDIAARLFEALGKPLPELASLTPHNQALELFNVLNTTDRARLVVLDQFENLLSWQTGQVLPDRPGIGEWLDTINSQQCTCRILLTSRLWPQGSREYPPTYMQEYFVGGLEESESIELLRGQGVGAAQATEEELRMVVQRCAGHAYALTLLASILRRNRSLSLNLFLKDPAYVQLWTGNIARNLLDSIYKQQLDQIQRELLLAFSIYREPVPLDAAQFLIDIETKLTREQMMSALDALLAQHLLQAFGEGRYQIHPIVSSYALAHFDEDEKQSPRTAHTKAAQYYLQRAATSCPPRKNRQQISDVHDLIEAIWQYCQAEQRQEAYDLMEQEGIFSDLNRWGGNAILLELYSLLLPDKWHPELSQAALIYNDLGEVYFALSKFGEAFNYGEQALRIYKVVGDRKGEGEALSNLGSVYHSLGNKEQALASYQQALDIRREVGDRRGEGSTLNNLGLLYKSLDNKEQALASYQQALDIYRKVGDRRGEGSTLNNLGLLYDSVGNKEKALIYYQQALRLQREVGDRQGEGRTLNNLGRVYDDLGQKQEALKYFEQALRLQREVGDRQGEGRTLNNLGRVYDDLGQKQEALKYFEQALRLQREVGDRQDEGTMLSNLGLLYNAIGQREEALRYLEQALRIRSEVGDRVGEVRTLTNLGSVCYSMGKKEQTGQYFGQALSISRQIRDRDEEATALNNLGLVYADLGEKEVARDYYEQALEIFKELGDWAAESRTLNNLSGIYYALGDKKRAQEYYEQASSISKKIVSTDSHKRLVGEYL